MEEKNINILAISGSLRNNSSNTNILRVLASMPQAGVHFKIFEDLGNLPFFSPAIDDERSPAVVQSYRAALQAADAVVICTPEYAFGVPGVLKNALDWTVSSGEFTYKPVALITASSVGTSAHASLLLTFKALTAIIPEGASLLIPFIRTKINEQGEITDPATYTSLKVVLQSLVSYVVGSRKLSE